MNITKGERVNQRIEKLYPEMMKWGNRKYQYTQMGLDYVHSAVTVLLSMRKNATYDLNETELLGLWQALTIRAATIYQATLRHQVSYDVLMFYNDGEQQENYTQDMRGLTDQGRTAEQIEAKLLLRDLRRYIDKQQADILFDLYIAGYAPRECAKKRKLTVQRVNMLRNYALVRMAGIVRRDNELFERGTI